MKKEFTVERQGKTFVLYAGLLDEAHSRGLKAIRTKLLQIPSPENGNVAICSAEVETAEGFFGGLGDAAPENVSRQMLPHLIRMAETRAKARALRDSINVGVLALEELGDLDDVSVGPDEAGGITRRQEGPRAAAAHLAPQQAAAGDSARDIERQARRAELPETGEPAATAAQLRAIYLIGRDQQGMTEAQVVERASSTYNCRPEQLTKRQASELISALKRQS